VLINGKGVKEEIYYNTDYPAPKSKPIAQTPMSNLQSTALVEACYFGGKFGIVCSIIETLGQERGWGDMYCWPSRFTRVQRGWRKHDDSLAALFANGSALATVSS
jgi:hypothetical protein